MISWLQLVLRRLETMSKGSGRARPNRTAELPNGEFCAHGAPAFSKLRSLRALVLDWTGATCGYCAIIPESTISPEK
jgi:hypothetical protein